MPRSIAPSVFVGIALIGFGATVWAMYTWRPTDSGQMASWVQAIGSIVAIIATGFGVQWTHSLASQSAAESTAIDEVRKLAAIASCLFHCRAEAESLKRYCAYTMDISDRLDSLEKQVTMLQAINLLDLPDWRGAVAVGQALAVYSFLRGKLAINEPIGAMRQATLDGRVEACKHAVAKFGECEKLLRATLKERGSDVPAQQVDYADGSVKSLSAIEAHAPTSTAA